MKNTIFVLLILIPFAAMSGLKTENEIQSLTEQAMKKINLGDFDGAIGLLRPHWPLSKHEIDGLSYQIKQQQPTVKERFGKPNGYILACKEGIASVVKRYSYLQKFDKYAFIQKSKMNGQ